MPRSLVYVWRHEDAEFAERFREAQQTAIDRLEEEALRRAVTGYREPVFYQGEEVG